VTADYEEIRAHQHGVQQVIPLLEAIRSVAEIAFRRAEERLPPLERYASSLDEGLAELSPLVEDEFGGAGQSPGRSLLAVISSERGLCGGFNQQVVNRVRGELGRRRAGGDETVLACLGSRGRMLLEAAHEPITYHAAMPSFALPAYVDVEKTAIDLLDLMEERQCSRLLVVHNAPRHRFQYEVVIRQLFPLEAATSASSATAAPEVKPGEDVDALFTHLVTERVLIDLYRAVIESAISEELARVSAMRLATDNAEKLLDELTLDANRARQHSETNALLEIISGFRATEADIYGAGGRPRTPANP
jgi:F-type H+-transporting ATPase subunit gamma